MDTLAALDYKVPLWLIFKSKRSKAMLHNPAHQMEMIDHNIEDSKKQNNYLKKIPIPAQIAFCGEQDFRQRPDDWEELRI